MHVRYLKLLDINYSFIDTSFTSQEMAKDTISPPPTSTLTHQDTPTHEKNYVVRGLFMARFELSIHAAEGIQPKYYP